MYATPEFAWGLGLATARSMTHEDRRMREGGWQSTVGVGLYGKALGLLGLGRVGKRVAEYGRAFGMEAVAWSQNLTDEKARLVGERELSLMRPSAFLINTSRGPIVDEAALVAALRERRIAGAGVDVYDEEPLPPGHPLRRLDNVTLMPHLGYVTEERLRLFYADTAEAVAAFAAGTPIRVANPEALDRQRAQG